MLFVGLTVQAAIGIAMLIVTAMVEEGVDEKVAMSRIWLFDSRGLVVKVRQVCLRACGACVLLCQRCCMHSRYRPLVMFHARGPGS